MRSQDDVRQTGMGSCPKCHYQLVDRPPTRCPECATEVVVTVIGPCAGSVVVQQRVLNWIMPWGLCTWLAVSFIAVVCMLAVGRQEALHIEANARLVETESEIMVLQARQGGSGSVATPPFARRSTAPDPAWTRLGAVAQDEAVWLVAMVGLQAGGLGLAIVGWRRARGRLNWIGQGSDGRITWQCGVLYGLSVLGTAQVAVMACWLVLVVEW